jgi:hypothetical protein
MSNTSSARHNAYYVAEATYGTTPVASPELTDLRHTGFGLAITKNSTASEELHADRQTRDFKHGTRAVGGDIGIELSATSLDDFLEASLLGDWVADVLLAGVQRRSFSVLRHFTDQVAADKPYHLFTGCECNTFNLNVPADGIVTGAFGMIGQNETLNQDLSALGTPTFTDPTTTEVFDSFTGTVKEGGVTIAIISEIVLSLSNGIATRYAVGSDETLEPSIGKSNLTGSITAYFENADLIEKFLDETPSSLEFSLVDAAGNSYTFLIPKIKYTGGQPDATGEDSIPLSMPFQAIFDETEASNIKITRTLV